MLLVEMRKSKSVCYGRSGMREVMDKDKDTNKLMLL